MILTSKHLAVIRAALEFWDNEMSPHAPSISSSYFDEPIGDGDWVSELRAWLPTCQLRYAHCSPNADTLLNNRLLQTLKESDSRSDSDSVLLATVLIDEPVNGFPSPKSMHS